MAIPIDVGRMVESIREMQAGRTPGPRVVQELDPTTKFDLEPAPGLLESYRPPEPASRALMSLAVHVPRYIWQSVGIDPGTVVTAAQVGRAANAWMAIEFDNYAEMVGSRILAQVSKEQRR